MTDPNRRNLTKQPSVSHIEQSMRIIDAPQNAPVVIYPGPLSEMSNMSKADLEIAQRLQRLRKSSKEVPSEDDVASQLAKLKGLPPDYYSKKQTNHFAPETRTQAEQASSLLSQVMEEVRLDSQLPNPDDEIANRLSKLRGGNAPTPIGFEPVQQVPHVDTHIIQSLPSPADSIGFSSNIVGDTRLEAEKMIQPTEASLHDAKIAFDALKKDGDVAAAIASAIKKHKKKKDKKNKKDKKVKKKSKGTSSDERFSSDSEYVPKEYKKYKNYSQMTEKEEVDRIVQMYSKKKKKSHKSNSSSSSDSDSSMDSDKFSDSD